MEEKYFIAKVTLDSLDEASGKIKKLREEKLKLLLIVKITEWLARKAKNCDTTVDSDFLFCWQIRAFDGKTNDPIYKNCQKYFKQCGLPWKKEF